MWANAGEEGGRGRCSRVSNTEPRLEVFNSWITPSKGRERGMTLIRFSVCAILSLFFLKEQLQNNNSYSLHKLPLSQMYTFKYSSALRTLTLILANIEHCWPSITLGYSYSQVLVLHNQIHLLEVLWSYLLLCCASTAQVHTGYFSHFPQDAHHLEGSPLHSISI